MGKACEDNACVVECEGNWENNGGYCYLWSASQLTKSWEDAEEFCRKERGHLASITSETINEYIYEEKKRRGLAAIWIGGIDREEEGVWKWSDGSPWNFTEWNRGQPSNRSGEHCLQQFGYSKKWNDYECTDENNFVCSQTLCSGKNGISLRTKHSFIITLSGSEQQGCSDEKKCGQSCEENWEKNGNHCFYWSTDTKTWDEAEEFCREEGAHLASVTSKAINDYIAAGLQQKDHFLWIGGSDKESEGNWKWSDGSAWEFANWGTIGGVQQPSNHSGHDCLEYQRSDRTWNDLSCHNKRKYLCSKKLCSGEKS